MKDPEDEWIEDISIRIAHLMSLSSKPEAILGNILMEIIDGTLQIYGREICFEKFQEMLRDSEDNC